VRASAVELLARTGLPLVCGGGRRRVVALTFDDGPGPYTARLLALLRRNHARATFFLVGDRIAGWPAIPAAEAQLGAVGDHTWSHAYLPRLSDAAATGEIVGGRTAAERAVHSDVRLFRPPYDGRSGAVGRDLRARGMLEVLWSIDPSDYLPGRSADRIVRYVAARLRPGSIVLLHDIQPHTVEVVRRLLPILHRRRLTPVGIPELLRVDPPSPRLLATGGAGCWS
jgi:peptidoglycan/xylan/chitin deacetylase (PgdA/CDA1 family)